MLFQLFVYLSLACTAFGASRGPIDLTYDMVNIVMPLFPNASYMMNVTGNASSIQTENVTMTTDVGTHVQAPCRYAKKKQCISEIPVESLTGPVVVIDIRNQQPDVPISATQITAWEKKNFAIPAKSIVIIDTQWGDRWGNKTLYTGTNNTNSTNMHFPGLGKDAADTLIKRGVVGVGIDTLSVDYGQANATFPAHKAFADANIYTILNVANIKSLSGRNYTKTTGYVLPMKFKGAGAAPCRFFVVQNGVNAFFTKSASFLVAACLIVLAYLK